MNGNPHSNMLENYTSSQYEGRGNTIFLQDDESHISGRSVVISGRPVFEEIDPQTGQIAWPPRSPTLTLTWVKKL